MTSPLEKAARALGEVYDGYADPVETPNNWARAVEGARAVILAIREPSPEMIGKGAGEIAHDVGFDPDRAAGDIWSSMIDAALSD